MDEKILTESVTEKLSELLEAGIIEESELDEIIEAANENELTLEEFNNCLCELFEEEYQSAAIQEILESIDEMIQEGELTEEEATNLIEEGLVEYVLESNYNLSQSGSDGEEAGAGKQKDEAMSNLLTDKETEDLPENKEGDMAGTKGPSKLNTAIFKLFGGGSDKVADKEKGTPDGSEKQTGQD
jgi:polyhydroxyalkanoate synthesis regulator phasin